MDKKENKTEDIRLKRPQLYVKGQSGNPFGRPKETKEQKIIRKATKELISDYKDKLAEALPKISPVLIREAISGNMIAIKEIHDRVMGKPPQDINLGQNPDLPFTVKIQKDEPTTRENSENVPEAV